MQIMKKNNTAVAFILEINILIYHPFSSIKIYQK
jgi:hypothetical protein